MHEFVLALDERRLADMGLIDYYAGRPRYQCNCAGYGIGYQFDYCDIMHASSPYGKKK